MTANRADNERVHGKNLARQDPEIIWGWASPAGRQRAERRAKLITKGARLGQGKNVLEIGCGTGYFTEIFAGSGARILGVDISPELVQLASERGLPPEMVRIEIKRFEECDLDGPFDAVIGSSILHHLELNDALSKIYNLLKPGGRFCFAEPNMLNPQIMAQKNIPWLKAAMGDSPDETAFFRWSLQKNLREAGFVDIVITPFDWLHPATPEFLIPLVSQIGRLLEKTPFLQEFAGSLIIQCTRP
ncbi:class I SAM-dependent methyltransferase [Thermodesulfobacteriota bacterium]